MKKDNINEKCLQCNLYGYCQIYWGAQCKRQGGKKMPRMKKRQAEERPARSSRTARSAGSTKNTKNIEIIDTSIRTKQVNWA